VGVNFGWHRRTTNTKAEPYHLAVQKWYNQLDLGDDRLNKTLRLSHGCDPIDRSNDGGKVWGLLGLIATPTRDKILLVVLGGH